MFKIRNISFVYVILVSSPRQLSQNHASAAGNPEMDLEEETYYQRDFLPFGVDIGFYTSLDNFNISERNNTVRAMKRFLTHTGRLTGGFLRYSRALANKF